MPRGCLQDGHTNPYAGDAHGEVAPCVRKASSFRPFVVLCKACFHAQESERRVLATHLFKQQTQASNLSHFSAERGEVASTSQEIGKRTSSIWSIAEGWWMQVSERRVLATDLFEQLTGQTVPEWASESRTHKTLTTIFWPWLEPFLGRKSLSYFLLARQWTSTELLMRRCRGEGCWQRTPSSSSRARPSPSGPLNLTQTRHSRLDFRLGLSHFQCESLLHHRAIFSTRVFKICL